MKTTTGLLLLGLAVFASPPAHAQTVPATNPSTSAPLSVEEAIAADRDQLLGILNDPAAHQDQRDEAARRLAGHADQADRRVLLRILMNDANPRGQLAVARALGNGSVGDSAFVDPLFQIIGHDANLAKAAAEALGTFQNDPAVLQRLIDLAHSASAAHAARAAAIDGIGRFAQKRAAEALIHLLDVRPASLAQAADAALERMTGRPAQTRQQWQAWWSGMAGRSEADFAAALLQDRAPRYRRLEQRRILLDRTLETLLRDQYRLAADKKEMLLRYLESPAATIRRIGAELVVDDLKNAIPPAEAVREQLRSLIGDSSASVRLQVARTFAALNDQGALQPLLVQLAQEPDADVRAAQISALAPIRDLSAAPIFLKLLNDPSTEVAAAACRALDEIAPLLRHRQPARADQAAEALLEVIHSRTQAGREEDGSLRQLAIEALGALKYPPALRPLGLMLRNSETVGVRRAALRALGELGDSRAQDLILQSALDDPNDEIRLAAVQALGTTATFTAAEALYRHIQPAHEKNSQVRQAAWEVLARLFADAPPEQLALWPDRFNDQPQRQEVVLKALVEAYAKQGDSDRLAFARQNLGAVRMKLNRFAEAAGDFNRALQHWIDAGNNMLTQGLIRQNLEALLRSGQDEAAIAFASRMMQRHLSDQQTLGIAIRDQAQRLAESHDAAGLSKLIEATKKMSPPLDSNYTAQLQVIEAGMKK